ncbi:MAG: M28 family peptidase [Ignavibacteriae bacterium]|nr:M28 family peptidase [Ignavibacteriota bacterium]
MIVRLLVVLSLAFQLLSCSREPPKPQAPATQQHRIIPQSIPVFDGRRAFDYLVAQTKFGHRNPGSEGHRKCLNYLHQELLQYADAVNLQPFTHQGYDKEVLHLTNIIASFNLNATTRILLVAHWDTRPRADEDPDSTKHNQPIIGANDGASGVAVLLEIARHLKTTPPSVGIDILLTDGEDYGNEGDNGNYLLGARYFAKNLPSGFQPVFGILLDMVGDKQLELLKESNSIKFAPDVVELIWSTARELGVHQFTDAVQQEVLDDHIPLSQAGIRTVDLIDFDYPDSSNRYWHTTEDTPDKCSPESLEAVGKVIMHIIYTQPS